MCFRNYFCSLKNFISCADTISFLNGCKSSYERYDCNENDAPVNCRNGNEKQKSCQLIRYVMWKAELFDAGQCYYLIDNLDDDEDSSPDP